MFAVIRTGGKQYKVTESAVIEVEKINGAEGETVTFSDVLMASDDGALVDAGELQVEGKIISLKKGPKITIMKHRRRKNSRRKTGHRQTYTLVEITSIKKD